MSRFILEISSLAFRILHPHGLQTRSDSSAEELTSIPDKISVDIYDILSVAPYFSFNAHFPERK